jgi:hypothetical protein
MREGIRLVNFPETTYARETRHPSAKEATTGRVHSLPLILFLSAKANKYWDVHQVSVVVVILIVGFILSSFPGDFDQSVAQNVELLLGEFDSLIQAFVFDFEGHLFDQDVVDGILVINKSQVEGLRLVLLLQGVPQVFVHFVLQLFDCVLVVHHHFLIFNQEGFKFAAVVL